MKGGKRVDEIRRTGKLRFVSTIEFTWPTFLAPFLIIDLNDRQKLSLGAGCPKIRSYYNY